MKLLQRAESPLYIRILIRGKAQPDAGAKVCPKCRVCTMVQSFVLWYKCLYRVSKFWTVVQTLNRVSKFWTVVQSLYRVSKFWTMDEMFGARMRRGWLYCCIGGGDDSRSASWRNGPGCVSTYILSAALALRSLLKGAAVSTPLSFSSTVHSE
jgi:hypothetical protein